jgi:hypothetical protein
MLRAAVAAKTHLGIKAKEAMNKVVHQEESKITI